MDYVKMGQRIKARRRELKLTQETLSERVGISASFMGHIERGTRVASLETIESLCDVLNVNPDYLFGRDDAMLSKLLPDHLTQDQYTGCIAMLHTMLEVVMKLREH